MTAQPFEQLEKLESQLNKLIDQYHTLQANYAELQQAHATLQATCNENHTLTSNADERLALLNDKIDNILKPQSYSESIG